jgi:tight adherence protein B
VATNVFEAFHASACAAGVMALATGLYRLRRRAASSRRYANLLTEPLSGYAISAYPTPEVATDGRAQSRWQIELRHALAVIEARGSTLRGPTIAASCVCGLVGVATVTPALIALAVCAAIAAYALGAGDRRRRRFEDQALNALQLLSQGLRAGYSVPQSIALVARHSPEPTASEFSLAAQEISIGVQLADAIARLALRTANPDYNLVAIIVRVQHEVGGNLALILDSVGNTLRERFDLRRQMNALTAQQRLSSMILTGLPFGLLAFLFVMDRSFVDPLFTQPIGQGLLVVAGVMVFIGWTIMRSMGRIEV